MGGHTTVGLVIKVLSELKALRSLILELGDCSRLASVDGLRGFAGLTALVSLELVLLRRE